MTDALATVRALVYVEWRTQLGRFQRLRSNRAVFALLLLGVAAVVVVQLQVLGSAVAEDVPAVSAGARSSIVAVLGVLFGRTCAGAAARTPIRLRGADVTWVLPRPGGPRTLLGVHLVAQPARLALLVGIGTAVAALVSGGAVTWRPVAGVVLGTLTLRVLPAFTHLVALRLPRRAVQAVAAGVGGTVAVHGFTSSLDLTVPTAVEVAATPFVAVADTIVGAVLAPTTVGWAVLLGVGTVLIAVVVATLLLADGYQELAALRAWEEEALTAALRDGSMSGEVVAELVARQLRQRTSSFEGAAWLRGEAAFMWRALAQLRREWRRRAGTTLGFAAVAAAVAVFAPSASPVLVGMALLLVCVGSPGTVLEEAGHRGLVTFPGSPWRKFAAISVVPTIETVLLLLAVGIPALAVSDLDTTTQVAAVLAVPPISAAAVAAGNAGALGPSSVPRRLAAGTVATALALVPLGALVALLPTVWGWAMAAVFAAGIAVVGWHAGGARLAR